MIKTNMKPFNLFENSSEESNVFVRKYVTAMGYTKVRNRQPYRWWEYETLRENPQGDDDWQLWTTADNSLNRLLRDASVIRQKYLQDIKRNYGLEPSEGTKILKTYIGYHPSYGGYICQIAPYFSSGGGHGAEHIKEGGIDKFAYFIWRKRKVTQEDLMRSLGKNIEKWVKTYGIQFEPSDFAYDVKAQDKDFDPLKGRSPNKVTEEYVENLDPRHPRAQEFFQRSPMVGEGSRFEFNNNGYAKILVELMGPWYEEVIKQKAAEERKSQKQVSSEILSSESLLEEIYQKSLEKWEESRDRGEAAAMGIPPPPKFKDKSLRARPGAQWFTELQTNDGMSNQMKLKIQVLEFLKNGETDPVAIAQKLNDDPIRQKINYRRKYKKPPQPPIVITPNEVETYMSQINQQMQEKNQDISKTLDETISTSASMTQKTGYDDLKTAFQMAALYFSTEPIDVATHARLGPSNAVIFNPPENFENYTSEDLKRWREEKKAKDKGEVYQPVTSTPEDIARDIGSKVPESEKEKAVSPTPTGKPVEPVETSDMESEMEELIMGKTINNLIKVASELDSDHKEEESEEVHKVIRKYIERK